MEPSLFQDEPAQLPQPTFKGHVLQPPDHLFWPLDVLYYNSSTSLCRGS